MGIEAGYAVPHPPLIIASVGRGEERAIVATIESYEKIARRIASYRPETIVVSSPHAPLYRDGFHVSASPVLAGTMKMFGSPQERIVAKVDGRLSELIVQSAQREGIAIATDPWRDNDMDHGTFIPLYFVEKAYGEMGIVADYKVVRVGLSGLSAHTHRTLGQVVARSIESLDRRCVFIASGDLSHKLKADGPYGFAPEGPELDERLCEIFASGELEELFGLEGSFCERAAECGVRSFQLLAGALESSSSYPYEAELLSYEGPFGVGYAVAAFEHSKACDRLEVTVSDASPCDDPYIALARKAIEAYVDRGEILQLTNEIAESLPDDMLLRKAGVFVSLHEEGELRGCIGTIAPVTENIAVEIVQNAISAATRDPRFPPVQHWELGRLEISVDELRKAEAVKSMSELDPKRYGIIVSKGLRKGLLLPNLEGVDTVDEQVAIAKKKAGIRFDDENVQLERFEVIRHENG